MRCAYHTDYFLPLPPGHPFPMAKYPLLCARLLRDGVIAPEDLIQPVEANVDILRLVHTCEYLDLLATGTLDAAAVRKLGVPWSPALWRRSRLAAQGTLEAARAALEDGLAGNLAGGTHHAFPSHGEGFCVLNDVAIAIRVLQRAGSIQRALVIDLDVHQGNGTAAIFDGDADVFTFSVHGERNYPVRKMRSTLDVGLADGVGDDEYLELLERNLAGNSRELPRGPRLLPGRCRCRAGGSVRAPRAHRHGPATARAPRARNLPPGRSTRRDHDRRRLRADARSGRPNCTRSCSRRPMRCSARLRALVGRVPPQRNPVAASQPLPVRCVGSAMRFAACRGLPAGRSFIF